jgi:RimJ/RimL family protein N-acetyltransferase
MSAPLPRSCLVAAGLVLADGARVSTRPIEPADRDALADGFARLSARSRYLRFLGPKPTLSPRELTYLTEVDHVGHEAIVAFDEAGDRMVGVARYAVWQGSDDTADVAVTVADDWHGRGLGTALVADVLQRARANGIKRLTGSTMWDNAAAAALLRRLGFRAVGSGDGAIDFRLDLAPM